MSPGLRSTSLPRNDGTMQNVQLLLQPTEMETQAAEADSGAAGNADGNSCNASAISTWATLLCLARSSNVGSEPMLWVPKTTSTHGALRSTSSLSFWARQPPTAICMSGLLRLRGARWLMLPYSLLSAFSRTAQVLKTTTSASSPSGARW